jgi:hypothetical protein
VHKKPRQLVLLPLQSESPPAVALSEKQHDTIRDTLGEAIVALVKIYSKEEIRDAERQQD